MRGVAEGYPFDLGICCCCCKRVFMTSRGWRETQETNPLRLPAIKSDAGIVGKFQRICLLTIREGIIIVISRVNPLLLDPF
jgi:hypothetical protein